MPEMRQMIINTDKSKPYDDGRLKRYLICIKSKYSEDSWDFIEGREDAYEYIKDRIDDIDFETSFIVVSSQKIDDRKSIYAFMNYADRSNIDRMSLLTGKTLFEFGYCITCHLAQGSQYDTVLVYVENGGNSLYFRQWLYTAITRAKKRLILVM